jgi:hypothetical protein
MRHAAQVLAVAEDELAAPAHHVQEVLLAPRAGLQHAFANGADFATVGMFDFQIAEDVTITNEVVRATQNRDREWLA